MIGKGNNKENWGEEEGNREREEWLDGMSKL